MTVYVEKPAVNLREELASLRNQGGYQEQQFWFDSLVTNGTFDSDLSGWVVSLDNGTNYWRWSSGAARVVSDGTSTNLTQSDVFEVGKRYVVSFDIVATTGTLKLGTDALAANIGTSLTTGSYSKTFVATATALTISRTVGATDATIDNISIYEVDANDDVIHTMPKGWKPKDVFEDGLLQREGAAHDYEMVYDGFDYIIKPTVAPSATTQTCVIGVKA